MGVDGEHHLIDGTFEFHDGDGFGDEFCGLGAEDVDAEDFTVFCVGDDFDEAVVDTEDGGLGVSGEGEFADLEFVALFFGLGFRQADRTDLRLSVCAAGDAVAADGAEFAAGDAGRGDHAAHCADVGELGEAGDDVADGVDAGLGGLLGFIDRDEAAVEDDFGFFEADVCGATGATNGDEDFFGLFDLRLAVGVHECDFDAGRGLFDFFDFGAGVDVDAAFFEEACEFFGDFFVFNGGDAGEELEDGDVGAEAAEDGAELEADGACADDDEGFGRLGEGEDLDVGEDAGAGLKAGEHLGGGAGGEEDVFCLELGDFTGCGGDLDGVDAGLGGAGEAAEAFDAGDLVFLEEEVEALDVFGDDGVFALEDCGPVEGGGADAVDAEFGGVLEVVPDFSVEEEGLGGDAADVEAGAAELGGGFDQGNLEAVLGGADGRGVTGGAAADDCDVVDRLRQGELHFGALCFL